MPNRFKIVAGLTGAVAAYALAIYPLQRKNADLRQGFEILDEGFVTLVEVNELLVWQNKYLVRLLEKHGGTVTDFDMIAMCNPDLQEK